MTIVGAARFGTDLVSDGAAQAPARERKLHDYLPRIVNVLHSKLPLD
jgi:hypothetical protein